MAQAALDLADVSIKKFKAAGGKVRSLTEAEKKHWADTMPNIAMDLAKDVEKRDGYPATKILSAYMNALRAAGEKPIRNWDRE